MYCKEGQYKNIFPAPEEFLAIYRGKHLGTQYPWEHTQEKGFRIYLPHPNYIVKTTFGYHISRIKL